MTVDITKNNVIVKTPEPLITKKGPHQSAAPECSAADPNKNNNKMRCIYPFQSSKTFPLINPEFLPDVVSILAKTGSCDLLANDYVYRDAFSNRETGSYCFVSENLSRLLSKTTQTQITDSRYCAHLFTLLNTISFYSVEFSMLFEEAHKPFWYILQYLFTLEELFPPQKSTVNKSKFISLTKDINREEGHYLVKLFRRKVYNLYLKLQVSPHTLQTYCKSVIMLYQRDINVQQYHDLKIEYKALGYHLIQKSNRILKDYQIYYMNKTLIANTETPEECLSNTYIPEFVPILKDFYYKDPLKSSYQISKDLAFLKSLNEEFNKVYQT